MRIQPAQCFAVLAGFELWTAGSLCSATDGDASVDDHSGALKEIVVTARLLDKQYEAGGIGVGAVVGVDCAILGSPRMAGLMVGFNF